MSALLSSFGDEIFLEDERFLDIATAVSGSGPAYVFLMLESMVNSAVHMGMPREVAEKLVTQTMLGSTLYAMQSNDHISKLRDSVTSPGGTTASALYSMEKGGMRHIISDGMWAAYRRSLELGDADSRVGPDRWQSGK